jgi:signal transduction histidine kinase
MHSALERQLRRLGLTPSSTPADQEAWQALLAAIDSSYSGADRSRYLLERSLQISSNEMQQTNQRQTTIANCSQALLFSGDDEAIGVALDHLLDATAGACAAVGLEVVQPDFDDPESLMICRLAAHDHSPLTELSQTPDLRTRLASGALFVSPGSPEQSEQRRIAHVPIMGSDGWIATLVVDIGPGGSWEGPELQMLRVVAEMFGAFLDQRSARRELERLGRSKDELIASVSHELRTPLTAVVGLSAELSEGLETFEAAVVTDLLGMIHRQSQDVAHIVEDLLVAARSSIGVLTIISEPVDLALEVLRCVTDFGFAEHPGLTVEASSVVALADPARLRQILRNLLTNAFRYGGDQIAIRTRRNGDQAVVSVSDDGPGVSEEMREAIFEPFTRAHAQTTMPGAVGVGLTVSRELAHLMGGELSYYDRGVSVFELSLQLAYEADDQAERTVTGRKSSLLSD